MTHGSGGRSGESYAGAVFMPCGCPGCSLTAALIVRTNLCRTPFSRPACPHPTAHPARGPPPPRRLLGDSIPTSQDWRRSPPLFALTIALAVKTRVRVHGCLPPTTPGLKAFFTTPQLEPVDKLANSLALGTSPIVRALIDPEVGTGAWVWAWVLCHVSGCCAYLFFLASKGS